MRLRYVEPRWLQAFVTVAREGSVSRAAEKLHLTQPAVSLQLKEMGKAIGVNLFQRSSTGIILTADGAALLTHAERALDGLRDFSLAGQRMTQSVRGVLRIGTILEPDFCRLGTFFKELVTIAPDIEPELHQATSGEVLRRLAAEEIDVGYYLGDPEAGVRMGLPDEAPLAGPIFQTKILARFCYRVIGPKGWGEQLKGRDWPELLRLPWILAPKTSSHSRLLSPIFQAFGQPKRVALVDQEASMLALVRAGVGISLARDSIAIGESQRSGLVIADQALECDLRFVCLSSSSGRPGIEQAWEAVDRTWL